MGNDVWEWFWIKVPGGWRAEKRMTVRYLEPKDWFLREIPRDEWTLMGEATVA